MAMTMDIAGGPLQGGPWAIRPDMGRVYDHWLGGSRSYQPDRDLAARLEQACEAWPGCPPLRELAARDRAYVIRAVRSAAAAGIRQVIDISTGYPGIYKSPWKGIPSLLPPCQAADGIRAAYVRGDPAAFTAVQGMLSACPRAVAVAADPCDPAQALGDGGLLRLIDPAAPVILVASRTLQFMDCDHAAGVLAAWAGALAPGSRLAAAVTSCAEPGMWEQVRALVPECFNHTATDMRLWFAAAKLRLDAGVEVARPWGPEPADAPAPIRILAAVGMKA